MFMLLLTLLGNDRPSARAERISEAIDSMSLLLVVLALAWVTLVLFS